MNLDEDVPRGLVRSVAGTMIDLAENSDEPKIFRTPAGKCPVPSSVNLYELSDDDHDEEDNEDGEQPDEEILEHDRGYKADYAKRLRCDEEYDQELLANTPDLHSYFAKFGLPNFSVIAICRTYANYLAQQERSKFPKVKKINIKK